MQQCDLHGLAKQTINVVCISCEVKTVNPFNKSNTGIQSIFTFHQFNLASDSSDTTKERERMGVKLPMSSDEVKEYWISQHFHNI